jgi:Rrf2 family protein
MHLTARADYALRAMAEIAAANPGPMKAEQIAQAQNISLKFMENILATLKHAGVLRSQRGAEGGYWLARPADQITLAEVIRAVDGPLANVRGERPESTQYRGPAKALREVWVAVRASLRTVLEEVTLADLVKGKLPPSVLRLTKDKGAWVAH